MTSLKTLFPNLNHTNHRVTSNRTEAYNCIAWAMQDGERWWQPHADYYWPNGIALADDEEPTVAHVTAIFVECGFELMPMPRRKTSRDKTEADFNRIAVFGTGRAETDRFTHVARQLDTGWWASKIGDWEDIEHLSLDVLEGIAYGKVAAILRRPKLWQPAEATAV